MFPSHDLERLLVEDVDYSLTWTSEFDGRLQIFIDQEQFDQNKVYTVDYYAASSASKISVLDLFKSKKIVTPDSFSETDKDDKVVSKYFPYVNYGIINSDDFSVEDNTQGFVYTPPTGVISTGLIEIFPNWIDDNSSFLPISGSNLVLATGYTGVDGNSEISADFGELANEYLNDPYRYYLKLN